ncbi:MAG: nucleoside deaminase [Clostridia bacterium]|nr:nucleoside deaminase [Clostridia bacterium]
MRKLTREEKFMNEALKSAKRALKEGEVPIGAVVVYQDKVVSRGYNRRTKLQLASAHAEMTAIDKACKKFHSWRLPEGCELFVTLEPCPMCMGACLNARVDKIYFGAYEQKGRSLTLAIAEANLLNHKTEVIGGVREAQCSGILTYFFSSMRQKQKEEKERKKAELSALVEEDENGK